MFSGWWDGLLLNALVFLLAVGLDRFLPEPTAKIHPVVWIGRTVALMARAAPQGAVSAFVFGFAIVLIVVGIATTLAFLAVAGLLSVHPLAYVIGGAVILWTTFTVKGLSAAARQTCQTLGEGRLDEARTSLRNLVSRDSASLTAPLVAASAIESVAENTTDSFVGPWLAFALFGVPGAVAYRALNTMDSMLGYRGRYEYLGKVAARLDDLANLIPARLSTLLLLVSGALSRLSAARAWSIMLRDRRCTASPNAGLTMSAMAGLLGVRLEKLGQYCLGGGLREPKAEDIAIAIRVAERTAMLGVLVALGLLLGRHAIVS